MYNNIFTSKFLGFSFPIININQCEHHYVYYVQYPGHTREILVAYLSVQERHLTADNCNSPWPKGYQKVQNSHTTSSVLMLTRTLHRFLSLYIGNQRVFTPYRFGYKMFTFIHFCLSSPQQKMLLGRTSEVLWRQVSSNIGFAVFWGFLIFKKRYVISKWQTNSHQLQCIRKALKKCHLY